MKKICKILMLLLVLNMTFILVSEGKVVNAATTTKMTFKERLSEKRKIRKSESRIKKATKAINKGKYEKVLDILKPELIYADKEKVLYTMAEKYLDSKKAFDLDEIEISEESLAQIDESYNEYNIAKDINSLKKNIELRKSEIAKINSQMEEVTKLIAEDKIDQAANIINVLEKDNINEYQKANLEALKINLEKRKEEIAEAKRIEEEQRKAAEEEAKRLAEVQRQEEARRAEEERKRQEQIAANKNNNYNNSSNNNYGGSGNSSSSSSSSSGGTYYVAAGNRYYHKSPSCKFLEGAATTAVNDVSNKFACNCVKYN